MNDAAMRRAEFEMLLDRYTRQVLNIGIDCGRCAWDRPNRWHYANDTRRAIVEALTQVLESGQ